MGIGFFFEFSQKNRVKY